MAIYRLSAIERLGVPLDDLKEIGGGPQAIHRFMSRFDIEPVLVAETDLEDVTPFYWTSAETDFRYLLTARKAGEVVVDVMPYDEVFLTSTVDMLAADTTIVMGRPQKMTYELPQRQRGFVIAGASSEYPGKFCIHEAFVDLEILDES
ncbi:MAG TPA: hypothetical protein VF572_00935 [Candidatus Saccharimonadales bacterium]|jgi:hypothetical protein